MNASTLDLSQIANDILAQYTKLLKDNTATICMHRRALVELRRSIRTFAPEQILPSEFFGNTKMADLLLRNVIDPVLNELKSEAEAQNISLDSAQRRSVMIKTERDKITGLRTVFPLPETWRVEYLQRDSGRAQWVITVPCETLSVIVTNIPYTETVTLPEGALIITLHKTSGGITLLRDYVIAPHLRAMYGVDEVKLTAANSSAGSTLHLAQAGTDYLKPANIHAHVADVATLRILAGNVGSTANEYGTKELFSIRRPANFYGGGRLLATSVASECIDPDSGRAYSTYRSAIEWYYIPHGHRIPRKLTAGHALFQLASLASLNAEGAQKAFDLVLAHGVTIENVVTAVLNNAAYSDNRPVLQWLNEKYLHVVDVDGTAQLTTAPTAG